MTDYQNKENAPHAVSSMVLGILSIITGCYIVGFVLGIIGLVLANNGTKEYNSNPEKYNGEGMLKAGKICSIVGLILGAVSILYWIVVVLVLGSTSAFAFSDYF